MPAAVSIIPSFLKPTAPPAESVGPRSSAGRNATPAPATSDFQSVFLKISGSDAPAKVPANEIGEDPSELLPHEGDDSSHSPVIFSPPLPVDPVKFPALPETDLTGSAPQPTTGETELAVVTSVVDGSVITNELRLVTVTVPRANVVAQPPFVVDSFRPAVDPGATVPQAEAMSPIEATAASPMVLNTLGRGLTMVSLTALGPDAIKGGGVAPPSPGTEANPTQPFFLRELNTARSNEAPPPQIVITSGATIAANAGTGETGATVRVPADQAVRIADSIAEQARAIGKNETTEFHLRLAPPSLGRMDIRLVATGEDVRAHLLVANDEIRRAVESQIPHLRERLDAAGVTVSSFDVRTDTSGPGRRPNEPVPADVVSRPARSVKAFVPTERAVATGRLDVTA